MFDFMRRKKDVQSEADQPVLAKPKDKQRARRTSLMLPVRTGAYKKRERPMSGSFVSKNIPSEDIPVGRPSVPRASSSSSSAVSFEFRNPFLDDGEPPRMTTSQLDLTSSMGTTTSEPATTNIRHVARGSPTIVHPQGEHAEVFYHGHIMADPFADETSPDAVYCETGETDISERRPNPEDVPVRPRRRRSSATASCRKTAEYLHVNIPVTVFTPPLGVGRREIWARV